MVNRIMTSIEHVAELISNIVDVSVSGNHNFDIVLAANPVSNCAATNTKRYRMVFFILLYYIDSMSFFICSINFSGEEKGLSSLICRSNSTVISLS